MSKPEEEIFKQITEQFLTNVIDLAKLPNSELLYSIRIGLDKDKRADLANVLTFMKPVIEYANSLISYRSSNSTTEEEIKKLAKQQVAIKIIDINLPQAIKEHEEKRHRAQAKLEENSKFFMDNIAVVKNMSPEETYNFFQGFLVEPHRSDPQKVSNSTNMIISYSRQKDLEKSPEEKLLEPEILTKILENFNSHSAVLLGSTRPSYTTEAVGSDPLLSPTQIQWRF